MESIKIRCSALGKIMGTPRSKKETLTQTAKTYIQSLVKQHLYGYHTEVYSKYLDKGNECEDESINLYNSIHFTNYTKNKDSVENEFIKGTCDILTSSSVIDIKTSWSLEQFPAMPDDGMNSDYEWQLRGYMWLYGKELSELAYCMVDTPDWLVEIENNKSIHKVSHIDECMRVTSIYFTRCLEKEHRIAEKVKLSRDYASTYMKSIISHHKQTTI